MSALNMAKGLIPRPKVVKKIIGDKPVGVGWSDYGTRTCRGIVLHRMQGTLGGTYQHFSRPDVAALTDFGINSQTGEIWQYNDPFGRRSGWASGPVSAAYGDGKAFIAKYGVIAVNRDQISLEWDKYFIQPGEPYPTVESPVSAKAIQKCAEWIAPYAHDYGIPWDVWPIAPQDGFSFVRWHQEFTIGTGKVCPGKAVMDATPRVIEAVRAILKKYQTGGTVTKPTTPETPEPSVNGIPYSKLFGKQYDPNGTVSKLWRENGAKTGKYPPLHAFNTAAGYFQFGDGSVIQRAKDGTVSYIGPAKG